jgi:hypothetical protein
VFFQDSRTYILGILALPSASRLQPRVQGDRAQSSIAFHYVIQLMETIFNQIAIDYVVLFVHTPMYRLDVTAWGT